VAEDRRSSRRRAHTANGRRALRHTSLPAASAAPNRFRDPHRAGSAQLTAAPNAPLAAVDKDQPVSSLTTVDSLVAETFALPRFNLTLVGAFRRLRAPSGRGRIIRAPDAHHDPTPPEIGIRMAIGARRTDIVKLILQDGLRLTTAGIAIGAAAAFLATRLLAAQLPGMRQADLATLTIAAAGSAAIF